MVTMVDHFVDDGDQPNDVRTGQQVTAGHGPGYLDPVVEVLYC